MIGFGFNRLVAWVSDVHGYLLLLVYRVVTGSDVVGIKYVVGFCYD
jgi:hypothetical protein